jgi:hypothetical protein
MKGPVTIAASLLAAWTAAALDQQGLMYAAPFK